MVAGVVETNNLIPDVLILCGGLGTRFRPVRDDIPKVLAPIRGKPFLDWILDDLLVQGIGRVILATGYLANQITDHVEKHHDVECFFSEEPQPLGTGGAIKYAAPYFKSDLVVVLNGDSYIHVSLVSLVRFHRLQNADMTLTLSTVTKGKDYGKVIVNSNHRVVGFTEKDTECSSGLTNAGLYCFNKQTILDMPYDKRFSLETDWLSINLEHHHIYGMTVDQPVYDIGTPERYQTSQNYLYFANCKSK